MMNDETLYRRFINGDESALHELMERYGHALTLYIAGIIHDIYDAEDLMIDAYMRIVTKKPHIWDNCFKAYLYKTARNQALRFLQKKRFHVSFGFDNIENEPDVKELVYSVQNDNENSLILHTCINQLHSDYGEALFLHHIDGGNYEKIRKASNRPYLQRQAVASKNAY